MMAELLEELPEEMRQRQQVKFLSATADRHAANIVQLIYRAKGYEGNSKDYEFPPLDGGALAGRLPRRRARAPPSRDFRAIKAAGTKGLSR